VLWSRKPKRPLGFYTGWMCVAYAPVRFVLDFMRVGESEPGVGGGGDPRYAGLTPAQWACFGLLAMGIYFLRKAKSGEVDATETSNDENEGEDDGEEERPQEKAPASGP